MLMGLCGLIALACGGEGSGGSGGPFGGGGSGGVGLDCTTLTNPPPGCDDACPSGSDSECALGTFCENGRCTAQCTEQEGCGEGFDCNVRGRCVPDVSTGGMGGTGNTGGNGCQSVQVTPTRSIPNVMFLVDQSGSMVESFGGGQDRWEAAHSAINSIVSDLDSIVRFGLTTYTSRNGFQSGRSCPLLPTQIDFDLNNSSTFGNDSIYPYSYPSADGEDTPTGDSIDALVGLIQANPPPPQGPTIIVLATDGEPDSCECADNWPNPTNTSQNYCEGPPTPTDPRIEAVSAAANAHASGLDLYVLWVGALTSDSIRNHIQDVADAGIGQADAPFWIGTDPEDLENEFRTIISASISCEVQIDKPFDDVEKACNEGDVKLGGTQLSCPDGDWRVKPGANNVIELLGSACDTFKSGDVTLTAEFPCGAIIVE
ncbi:MAG: hypothetical protein AMJ62_15205 [Myxococcales bacterium SG8_38]|nr:MAG: hypothetical protein AMJ62_15205 [Myxococcales bacterium SG8_38]